MGVVGATLRYLGLAGSSTDGGWREATSLLAGSRAEGTALGSRLSFRGELTGEGDFHVLGKFDGEIDVAGRVYVAEGAQVDANINAAAIVIGGTVRGNLSASTRVEILPTGVLTGTLKTTSFAAADGASVKGEIWVERGSSTRGGEPGARS
jgi:cytoskeletal protein CcmA (bactofilin family)